eukprot:TRINITY_DN18447_c0_g1_i3.p3 TRINITY_DN18447_c0_g1~~TRINITY_DN18447_c0_g1_i3.p3  ORF type:complete len:200 (+),score=33.45 TRINITY_DN18447_c0_g1_i3:2-601(+)
MVYIVDSDEHNRNYLDFEMVFFFFSSRRRHTRCREVSWARRCVQETGVKPWSLFVLKSLVKTQSWRGRKTISEAERLFLSRKVCKKEGTKLLDSSFAGNSNTVFNSSKIFDKSIDHFPQSLGWNWINEITKCNIFAKILKRRLIYETCFNWKIFWISKCVLFIISSIYKNISLIKEILNSSEESLATIPSISTRYPDRN